MPTAALLMMVIVAAPAHGWAAGVVQEPASASPGVGVRQPSYAADGRLAVTVAGDIWVLSGRAAVEGAAATGTASARESVRVTSGPAWDRDPVWSADGGWILFASDRSGQMRLWRVAVDSAGPAGDPEPAASGAAGWNMEDGSPTIAPDGSVVFVRGRAGDTDLWVERSGKETRLTSEPGAEQDPVFSPDGTKLLYVAVRDGERELRLREMSSGDEKPLERGAGALSLAWGPDGRIVFATGGRSPGVWVTDTEGTYLQQVSRSTAEPAWSPDGAWIVLAPAAAPDVGYNGDPDRLGSREGTDVLGGTGGLRQIPAPAPPDAGAVAVDAAPAPDRRSRNAEAYDRVWDRVARFYYGREGDVAGPGTTSTDGSNASPALAQWRAVGMRYRGSALEAKTDDALEQVIYRMVSERPPARQEAAGRAAVSSAHPAATEAGLEILRLGGNAVDAAVAVSFALGVVEPDASGPGGYGEMLIYTRDMPEPTAIEFMTRVPQAATLDNPLLRDDVLPRTGPALVNVPGTVAGMGLAWDRYGSGKVSWKRILEPAIRLAERGWVVDAALATTLRREREAFERYAGKEGLFFRDGRPLQVGDTLRNPDLAWTLHQIADGGAHAFYTGEPAKRLVADLRAHGNTITLEDMKRYFAVERRPVRTTYRGHTVYSGPPPVTGGATLAAKLNLLEHAAAGSSYTADPAELHALIEAWQLQPSTANRIADPDLWPVDISPFESKDTAAARWRCFDPQRSTRVPATSSGGDPCGTPAATHREGIREAPPDARAEREECEGSSDGAGRCRATGTTAFAIVDAEGNAVAATQTLGTWGGDFYATPGLGFLYNDKLRSYRTDPDAYGSRIPYARNSTVIAPTLVFRGTGENQHLRAALGAAGNAWITSAVYTLVVGIIDHQLGPQRALELPRFLPSGRGGGGMPTIQYENAFSPAAIRALRAMHHDLRAVSRLGELRMGYGAAVVLDGGVVRAGADPRRSGAAGAIR